MRWQRPAVIQDGPEDADPATYERLSTSLKGSDVLVLSLDNFISNQSMFTCLDLQHLLNLHVTYDPHVHPDFLLQLCATLPALRSLSLQHADYCITHTPWRINDLARLKVAFPNLSSLSLMKCQNISEFSLYKIGRYIMPFVQELDLNTCEINKEQLQALVRHLTEFKDASRALCPSLLAFHATDLVNGYDGLQILAPIAHHLPNLRRLIFKSDNSLVVTDEIKQLRENLGGQWPHLREIKVGASLAHFLKGVWLLATVH